MSNGYLLATRYEVLYQRALSSYGCRDTSIPKPIYGIPFPSHLALPEKRYRGIDREPLQALSYADAKLFIDAGIPSEVNDATNLLSEIENRTRRDDGWTTSLEDIVMAWKLLGDSQSNYEIIWAKECTDMSSVPGNCEFLGCDAAYFVKDNFSCICDALFFPRWHGTDEDGVLFMKHYDLLNRNGLFDSNESALDYLRYYLSFDWTERDDDFTGIEVYCVGVS